MADRLNIDDINVSSHSYTKQTNRNDTKKFTLPYKYCWDVGVKGEERGMEIVAREL